MVHVTHHGDDGRTGFKVFFAVGFLGYGFAYFRGNVFGAESEFFGHDVDGLGVETLVDGYHHAHAHAGGYDVVDGHVHHRREVVGRHEFGELEHAAFSFFHFGAFVLAVGECLTFFFTPFRSGFLAFVSFGGKSGQHFLDLFLHILFVHFIVDGATVVVAVAVVVVVLVVFVGFGTLFFAVVVAVAALSGLLAGFFHVDFLAGDAFAFLAVACVGR